MYLDIWWYQKIAIRPHQTQPHKTGTASPLKGKAHEELNLYSQTRLQLITSRSSKTRLQSLRATHHSYITRWNHAYKMEHSYKSNHRWNHSTADKSIHQDSSLREFVNSLYVVLRHLELNNETQDMASVKCPKELVLTETILGVTNEPRLFESSNGTAYQKKFLLVTCNSDFISWSLNLHHKIAFFQRNLIREN